MSKSVRGKSKLSDEQREALLEWMAEGLTTKEINDRSLKFVPPFEVSSQLVYQYRIDYGEPLQELMSRNEMAALRTGLAVKANRLEKLQRLAALLEEDLLTKMLTWTEDKKMVGNETVTFKQFNAAEIKELRGLLDDIAKETGGRVLKADITSGGQPIKGYVGISPEDWDAPEGPAASKKGNKK
jgi:hypothetical protein